MTDPQNVVVTVAMTEVKTIDITYRLCTRGRNNSYEMSAKIPEVEIIAIALRLCTRGRNN